MTKEYTDKLGAMVTRLETKALRTAKRAGKKRNSTPEKRRVANQRAKERKRRKRLASLSAEPESDSEDDSEWQTV